jgi:hypothetical protein
MGVIWASAPLATPRGKIAQRSGRRSGLNIEIQPGKHVIRP